MITLLQHLKRLNTPVLFAALCVSIVMLGCTDEAPVMPGLAKGGIALATLPDSADVFLNGKQLINSVTPVNLNELEPGFYKIEIKRTKYLDTTYYLFVQRGKTEKLTLPLREDPAYWWKTYKKGQLGLTTSSFDRVEVTPAGVVWASSPSLGVWKIERDTAVRFHSGNSPLPSNSVFDILCVRDGSVWFATGNGLAAYKNGNWLTLTGSNSNMPAGEIRKLYEDAEGAVWFASKNGGVGKYTPGGITLLNKDNSLLPVNPTQAVALDDSGSVWVSLEGNGIFQTKDRWWKWFTPLTSGVPSSITCFKFVNGKMYCASGGFSGNNSVFYIQNGKVTALPVPAMSYLDIKTDKFGGFWFSSGDEGAVYYSGNSIVRYTSANSGLPTSEVLCCSIAPDGSKWFATPAGLARYIGGR